MLNPLCVLPLHLACQILASQNYSALMELKLDTHPKLATEFPPGYIVLPDKGVAYKWHNLKVQWNTARNYCAAEGGYLAVVDTIEKLNFVMDMNKSGTHMHVGFHKLFGDGEWNEVKTGMPGKIPWRPDPIHGETRLCTAIIQDRTGIVAIGCNEPYTFVCEISIFKD